MYKDVKDMVQKATSAQKENHTYWHEQMRGGGTFMQYGGDMLTQKTQ